MKPAKTAFPFDLTRRQFIHRSALSAATVFFIGRSGQGAAANEKLNIGVIGVAGRGGDDLRGVSSQNIVALCDVDSNNLAADAKIHPQAKTYADWRWMLDQKDIEAVVVGTPDHVHAIAAVNALKSGRHVYCEKPLTLTVSESRILAETAKQTKLATQMGTQIHAESNYRRVVEHIQSGAIGKIQEVHVWVDSPWPPMERPTALVRPPQNVNWDLWLGPAAYRSFSPEYVPFKWRGWWAFGGGTLGDFGCHYMDLAHWALDLRHPVSVEAEGPPAHPERVPSPLIVRYQYPARGPLPPVKLTWYQNGKRPPHFAEGLVPANWGGGHIFVGEKGMILSSYRRLKLLPEKDFANFTPPEKTIPDSIGHHEEWIRGCKTGEATTCNFEYGCALTETVLLGNVAHRVGKKLEWDTASLKARNAPEADRFIQHHYREGWRLEG